MPPTIRDPEGAKLLLAKHRGAKEERDANSS